MPIQLCLNWVNTIYSTRLPVVVSFPAADLVDRNKHKSVTRILFCGCRSVKLGIFKFIVPAVRRITCFRVYGRPFQAIAARWHWYFHRSQLWKIVQEFLPSNDNKMQIKLAQHMLCETNIWKGKTRLIWTILARFCVSLMRGLHLLSGFVADCFIMLFCLYIYNIYIFLGFIKTGEYLVAVFNIENKIKFC